MLTTSLLASILLLAAASPAAQQSPVPREKAARSHPPAAAHSQAGPEQDDLQQDLRTMRSLLDRMQANLVFVGAGPTPLRRQLELEIEMWRALIDHMEHTAHAGPQRVQEP